MPKITDILSGAISARANECAIIIQIASVLKRDVNEARTLIAKYGAGWIYTPGIMLADTPRNRAKLTEMYGEVVIILTDGSVVLRDRSCTGSVGRRQAIQKRKIERKRIHDENAARRKARQTERMFRDGKGHPCRKRQGGGRGVPCVPHLPNTYDVLAPKAHLVMKVINVPV